MPIIVDLLEITGLCRFWSCVCVGTEPGCISALPVSQGEVWLCRQAQYPGGLYKGAEATRLK